MDSEGMNFSMPVTPTVGGYGGNGGFGFGGDWAWIILLLVLCGGWGNGFGGGFGGGDVYPWLNNSQNINDGFRDQMIGSQISGIQNAITSGFGDIQTALCGGFGSVNASVTNGFAQAEIANNARQIADMQQNFAAQTATLQGFNGVQSQLSQCCCDNRLATVQTQNVVSSDGAATRAAIQGGIQTILDKLCQDKIDAKNEKIVELNNRINSLESNNYIQNALTAQTQYFLGLYPPPAPAV